MQCVRTQQTCVWTPADDQVMRFAGADVLQGQQRPVPGRAAGPHLGHRFARLDQREDLRGEENGHTVNTRLTDIRCWLQEMR